MTSLASYIEPEFRRLEKRLATLGIPNVAHMPYEQYLATSLWKKICSWVFERDGHQCAICDRYHGLVVHHRSYGTEVLEGKRDDLLVTLCFGCHEKVEHYSSGVKRESLAEKDDECRRLQKLYREIWRKGLSLKVHLSSVRGQQRLDIEYIGDARFEALYPLSDLLFRFAFSRHDSLRVPRNPRAAFSVSEGIRMVDRKSNKNALRISCLGNTGAIVKSKSCDVEIGDYFAAFVLAQRLWRIEGCNIQIPAATRSADLTRKNNYRFTPTAELVHAETNLNGIPVLNLRELEAGDTVLLEFDQTFETQVFGRKASNKNVRRLVHVTDLNDNTRKILVLPYLFHKHWDGLKGQIVRIRKASRHGRFQEYSIHTMERVES